MSRGIEQDVFGDCAKITVDKELYSEAAIFKAAYWFTDRYYLFLEPTPNGEIAIEIRGKATMTADDLKAAASEFCNSLIDFRVRERVMQQTATIRDALVVRAFAEGMPAGLPGVKSRER